MMASVPTIFEVEKRSIPSAQSCLRKAAASGGFDRLALGADLRDHGPDHLHAHAVGDLDVDIGVVDTLVTLPTMPPAVTTVSPRRTFLITPDAPSPASAAAG